MIVEFWRIADCLIPDSFVEYDLLLNLSMFKRIESMLFEDDRFSVIS